MLAPLLALIALLYPLLVFFGLQHFSLGTVSLALAALLALRLLLIRRQLAGPQALRLGRALLPAGLAALVCTLAAALFQHPLLLKLTPVVISAAFLFSFAQTLRQPPSMIEILARLSEPDLDARGVVYTRRVTQVWCGFFLLNGSIALYTALFADLAVWTVYNGLIAYVLMGLLFAVEYAVRCRVRARPA